MCTKSSSMWFYQTYLGRIGILTIPSLLIHEHSISVHLFRFFFEFFDQYLIIFSINIVPVFFRFMSKYLLMLTYMALNKILIPKYRNTIILCVLALYPVIILISLISSRRYMCVCMFIKSVRFFMQTVISSVNKDSFISSLLICMPFISFTCFIVLTRRTSRTILSENSEKTHSCPSSNFRKKALSLSF